MNDLFSNLKVVQQLGSTYDRTDYTKAKCISDYENNWGSCCPIKGNLEVGKTYDVDRIEVHSWHTKVYLKGFEKPFNSVHFELLKEDLDMRLENATAPAGIPVEPIKMTLLDKVKDCISDSLLITGHTESIGYKTFGMPPSNEGMKEADTLEESLDMLSYILRDLVKKIEAIDSRLA